jgi:SAM-dependent methyltransferase
MSAPEHTPSAESAYGTTDYARAFSSGYHRHFWHQARLAIVHAELVRLGPTGAVLDVGCGPGQYVRALQRRGYDAFGCDPGDISVDTDLVGRVFARTAADDLPATVRAAIDVVLLLDVLEHLADPVPMLVALGRALPRVRAAIVTVPARQELWSALDERAGHHRRYRVTELSAVIGAAGLAVADARYLFRALYPMAWLARRRAHPRVIRPPAYPGMHAVAGRLLALEARILPATVCGTSALCVARFTRPQERSAS